MCRNEIKITILIENYLISLFKDDNLQAIYNHRVTVNEKDIQSVRKIRENYKNDAIEPSVPFK
jgi:histone H3/H4